MSLQERDRYEDILDNYMLFVHNIQLQQNNMTAINNTIHAALFNLLQINYEPESRHTDEEEEQNSRRIVHQNTAERRFSGRRNPRTNTTSNRYTSDEEYTPRRNRHGIDTSYYNNNRRESYRSQNTYGENYSRSDSHDHIRSTQYPVNVIWPHTSSNFLNPVPVFPSSEQINNATTIENYGTIIDPSNTSCPIRNEDFSSNDTVIRINQCGHIFFINEFYGWFRENVRCPMCRRDIRNTTRDSSNNIQIHTTDLSYNHLFTNIFNPNYNNDTSLNDTSLNDISLNTIFIISFCFTTTIPMMIALLIEWTLFVILHSHSTRIEFQFARPMGDDISAANFELSVSFIDISNGLTQ